VQGWTSEELELVEAIKQLTQIALHNERAGVTSTLRLPPTKDQF